MNMEMSGLNTPLEKPKETIDDKSEAVAEVFKRYHKELIRWCMSRLNRISLKKIYVSSNPKSDAEEVVALVYQNLLASKNSVDLTRSDPEIVAFLNIILDHEMNHYVSKMKTQKRIPQAEMTSQEELSGEDEENIPVELKKYFTKQANTEEENNNHLAVESALLELEKKDERMANIIRQRYMLGETQKEAAKHNGITPARVGQIEQSALEKLKRLLKNKQKPLN